MKISMCTLDLSLGVFKPWRKAHSHKSDHFLLHANNICPHESQINIYTLGVHGSCLCFFDCRCELAEEILGNELLPCTHVKAG